MKKDPTMDKTRKLGYSVCFECGKKYGTPPKRAIGVWKDTCSICGKEDVMCAAAGHDYRIYEMPKEVLDGQK